LSSFTKKNKKQFSDVKNQYNKKLTSFLKTIKVRLVEVRVGEVTRGYKRLRKVPRGEVWSGQVRLG
jgi:hypothetical protein